MRAQLIRVEHAEPWYFTKYYYKCIDCGAEYTRHQCNERINPYCGKCQRKHETEAQRERNERKRNKETIRELELLYKDIHNFIYPLIKEKWIIDTIDKICEKHIENVSKGESNVL